VSELDKLGCSTTFSNGFCSISDPRGAVLLRIGIADGLYKFNSWEVEAFVTTRSMSRAAVGQRPQSADSPSADSPTSSTSPPVIPLTGGQPLGPAGLQPTALRSKLDNSFTMWHRRLAHLHHDALPKVLSGLKASGPLLSLCDICVRSKLRQKFERTPAQRCTVPFELVHSDLAGPFRVSNGGAVYYIVYVDDCTRFVEVFFLLGKTAVEVCARFAVFKASVETRGFRIKRFRCDNGTGEYNNKDFLQILSASGITYEPSPPYTQHKNGVSERMIRTLNTKARSMLLDAGLPIGFWAEAIKTAAYLHRRTPSASLPGSISPHEALLGSRPALSHLRRFGCKVYRHLPKEQRTSKFSDRARPCMMLGYVHHTTRI